MTTSGSLSVLMLADISGNIDEGMKVTAKNLSKALEAREVDVYVRNPYDSLSLSFWVDIRSYEPDIVHYVPGPSAQGILLGRLCSFVTRAPLIMSAPLPMLGPLGESLCRMIGPKQILTQSQESTQRFRELGVKTEFVPTGVDTKRFEPVDSTTKNQLREKYNLPRNDPIALHVGHIKENRNLRWLGDYHRQNDAHVLIVGSTSTNTESDIEAQLAGVGCDVRTEYFDRIEEIYALSDVYVFPTLSSTDSIQCPASVLEAMATNTPVVSTKFGALPKLFEDSTSGISFVDDYEDFEYRVNQVLKEDSSSPRDMVLQFDWEAIGEKVQSQYEEVIRHDK